MAVELRRADYTYDGASGSKNKDSSSSELMSMAVPNHALVFEALAVVVVVVIVAVAVVLKEIPCFAQGFSFKPRIQYSATGHASR